MTARSAVIGGVVKGDVYVTERLTVLDGGVIVGNVFAPFLDAEADVVLHGDVEVSGKLEGAEEALIAFMKRHDAGLVPVGYGAAAGRAEPWPR